MTAPKPRPLAYSYARLSSPAQRKGGGLQRQLEAARAFAAHHELDLVEWDDAGKSAYHGAHIRDGEFGKFIEKVNAGEIPSGTYLIIESLDRISRLEPAQALMVFLPLIEKGIVVATLIDDKIYKKPVNQLDLFGSMVIFARAHDQSENKSYHIRKSWDGKRKAAREHKSRMTRQCPAWLLPREGGGFSVDEARAAIIRRIFSDAASGLGSFSISRRLNADGIPAFRTKRGWAKSSVRNILANPNVIGRLQPHVFKDGERVPEGECIDNYYPPIIESELFNKVNSIKVERASGRPKRGRLGNQVANLFTGLLVCERCGENVNYRNKGEGPKGGKYLVCSKAERNLPCSIKHWPYQDFERSVLSFVSTLNIASIVADGRYSEETNAIERDYDLLRTRELEATKRRDFLDRLLSTGPLSDERFAEYRNLETEIIETRKKAKDLEARLAAYRTPVPSIGEVKEAVRLLQDKQTPDRERLRAQTGTKIRQLVDRIEIGFDSPLEVLSRGSRGYEGKLAEILKATAERFVGAGLERGFASGVLNAHYFVVYLRDGSHVRVQPDAEDPETVYTFSQMSREERHKLIDQLSEATGKTAPYI